MRWKQFLTPVKSLNVDQTREFIHKKPPDELTLLDVRQPNEYEAGHIPGSRLIPLPDLILWFFSLALFTRRHQFYSLP